jgi:hypothetical protein
LKDPKNSSSSLDGNDSLVWLVTDVMMPHIFSRISIDVRAITLSRVNPCEDDGVSFHSSAIFPSSYH